MQRWSAALEAEISTWPGVTTRPMFGMIALYRDGLIFGALPRTRALRTPFSVLVKLPGARATRLKTSKGPGAAWKDVALGSVADLPEAIEWFGRAYERARSASGRGR
jgi:hypothetical protein